VIALLILMPVLTVYADFVGIFGSFIAEMISANVSMQYYYSQVIDALFFADFIPGVGKTIAFGFAIAIIACYRGFNAGPGTEGVGKATTTAVVTSSLWIILIDMILVKLTVEFIGA
jgi:phospholipid/cholesterol/gamma-HCH transport system permease protein